MTLEIIAEHANGIGLGLATMDHHGFIEGSRQYQMSGEEIFLHRKRGTIPVAIEARFTERDHICPCGHLTDGIPVVGVRLGDGVGLDTDDRGEHRMSSSQGPSGDTGSAVDADGHDTDDTGSTGTVEHGRQVIAEAAIVQMGMSVDQFRLCHDEGYLILRTQDRANGAFVLCRSYTVLFS